MFDYGVIGGGIVGLASGYLSKPPASVSWQENRFREPQNT